MMNFETAARLGAYLAKDYAQPFFALLVSYQDISASEAASRLGLHIRTAQDFLDGLAELGIVSKEEVHEGKRPYNRYTLQQYQIDFSLDLNKVAESQPQDALKRRLREKKDSGAHFSLARGGAHITSVTLWDGEGRGTKDRKLNLTVPQGKFLFHLPFPDAEPLTAAEIMRKAELDAELAPEVLDIVDVLATHGGIEVV